MRLQRTKEAFVRRATTGLLICAMKIRHDNPNPTAIPITGASKTVAASTTPTITRFNMEWDRSLLSCVNTSRNVRGIQGSTKRTAATTRTAASTTTGTEKISCGTATIEANNVSFATTEEMRVRPPA